MVIESSAAVFCMFFSAVVARLKLDRDAKGAPFGLVQFKELGIARGCCLRRTFLVDDHVVLISASKSEAFGGATSFQ